LGNNADDGSKGRHTPAGERAALGTLCYMMRWERGGVTGNGLSNASIKVAIENIVDGAGRPTHNKGSNQVLEHFDPEGLQIQACVIRRHGQAPS